MSQFSHRPINGRADKMRGALIGARDGASDNEEVMRLWNDLRWRLKTLPERTYQAIEALIDQKIVECEAKLKTPAVKQSVIQKFQNMRARISEFMVGDEPEPEQQD